MTLGLSGKAIRKAQAETGRPSLIAVRTCIGCGSPNKQDTAAAHGEPLGPEEVKLTKENIGWPLDPAFHIPQEAQKVFRKSIKAGEKKEKTWENLFASYEKAYPDLAEDYKRIMNGDLPEDWEQGIPVFPADPKGMATRAASGTVLNGLAAKIPNLIGGSADLAPSNKTEIKGAHDFQAGNYDQRNIRFGVREHGMGSIMNGMALHGGLIPYGGTFLIFSDYMRPPIRLAAMMGLRLIYVFTHDSIGLGEDGPTHQPIEQLAALRAIPNLTVIRPADANETAEAWRMALKIKNGPTALVLTRQNLPTLDRSLMAPADSLASGAYAVNEPEKTKADLIIMASGSEVSIALKAQEQLKARGIQARVVSMPSWELFEQQPQEYRDRVLPPEIKARLAIEAGSPFGWHRYAGDQGLVIGLDHFGASAPDKVLFEKFGLTADRVVEKALELLKN